MYTEWMLPKEIEPPLEEAIKTCTRLIEETEEGQDMRVHLPSAMVIINAYLKIAISQLGEKVPSEGGE